MRIAIVNWSKRKAGGAETYLERLVNGLLQAGHETALFCEVDAPSDRNPISLPPDAPVWCTAEIGARAAMNALRGWHPDVIYGHGMIDPFVEAQTIETGPAVFFAHNYYGTCISGTKTFKYPVVRPCGRRFGWSCLAHFYPHRCGGLSPLTMCSDFKKQSQRLRVLHSYRAIVTASEYMRAEYLRHGFTGEMVNVVKLPTSDPVPDKNVVGQKKVAHPPAAYRLLFVGRMDRLKGGEILLDSLPLVLNSLDRPIVMTFVGEGPERVKWEQRAHYLESDELRLRFEFRGWLNQRELEDVFRNSDMLVVPSLWPEPFGLIGIEAGMYGLPAAGFAVGGIPEWLLSGVNGHIAPADPPAPRGLAGAVVRCLHDPIAYRQLSIGAVNIAQQFTLANHIRQVAQLFGEVIGRVNQCNKPRSRMPIQAESQR